MSLWNYQSERIVSDSEQLLYMALPTLRTSKAAQSVPFKTTRVVKSHQVCLEGKRLV